MSMNKIVLGTVFATGLMVASMTAFAMPERHAAMDPHAMAVRMQKNLNLSDEQMQKIEGIFKETQDEAEELRQDMMDLKQKTDEKIRAELTDEQAKKFDDMQKTRADRRAQRRS